VFEVGQLQLRLLLCLQSERTSNFSENTQFGAVFEVRQTLIMSK